jgi:serine/threonine protein kinase
MGICTSETKTKDRYKYNINTNTNTNNNTNINNNQNNNNLFSDNLIIKDNIRKYYNINEEYLGKGSCGEVCKATNKEHKIFAIKRINKQILTVLNNIKNEIQISLLLNHKNIIKTYEAYEDEKTISIVMDLVNGGDLFEYITSQPEGKLSEIQSLEIIIKILETINYLHNDLHICHRDIKPENFLVQINKDNTIDLKLIDFGFACFFSQKEKKMKEFLGTPIYTAPEILKHENYDEKCDIWSIGIILFNCLTGCQPFSTQSNNLADLDNEVLTKDIDYSFINNQDIVTLCECMLEKDPEKRFNCAEALESAKYVLHEVENLKLNLNKTNEN